VNTSVPRTKAFVSSDRKKHSYSLIAVWSSNGCIYLLHDVRT